MLPENIPCLVMHFPGNSPVICGDLEPATLYYHIAGACYGNQYNSTVIFRQYDTLPTTLLLYTINHDIDGHGHDVIDQNHNTVAQLHCQFTITTLWQPMLAVVVASKWDAKQHRHLNHHLTLLHTVRIQQSSTFFAVLAVVTSFLPASSKWEVY